MLAEGAVHDVDLFTLERSGLSFICIFRPQAYFSDRSGSAELVNKIGRSLKPTQADQAFSRQVHWRLTAYAPILSFPASVQVMTFKIGTKCV